MNTENTGCISSLSCSREGEGTDSGQQCQPTPALGRVVAVAAPQSGVGPRLLFLKAC